MKRCIYFSVFLLTPLFLSQFISSLSKDSQTPRWVGVAAMKYLNEIFLIFGQNRYFRGRHSCCSSVFWHTFGFTLPGITAAYCDHKPLRNISRHCLPSLSSTVCSTVWFKLSSDDNLSDWVILWRPLTGPLLICSHPQAETPDSDPPLRALWQTAGERQSSSFAQDQQWDLRYTITFGFHCQLLGEVPLSDLEQWRVQAVFQSAAGNVAMHLLSGLYQPVLHPKTWRSSQLFTSNRPHVCFCLYASNTSDVSGCLGQKPIFITTDHPSSALTQKQRLNCESVNTCMHFPPRQGKKKKKRLTAKVWRVRNSLCWFILT